MPDTLRLDARLNLPLDNGTALPMLVPITAARTATDGLVVFPAITGPLTTDTSCWYVTHAPSGTYIPIVFPDEASASRFAGVIGHLADWTVAKPEGFQVEELLRMGREHGGTPSQRVVNGLARRDAAASAA